MSLSTAVLLFILATFWLGYLHFPLFLGLFLFPAILFLSLYGNFYGKGKEVIKGVRSEWRYYALFGLVFLLMLITRAYIPFINGNEKFMDIAFINSIMRNPIIPPADPWFAGGTLSIYYYLGHWMIAVLGLTSGVPSDYLFNLAIPTIAGIAAVNFYGVGHLLLTRFRLLPVIFLFMMNPAFIQLFLTGNDIWRIFWNSTRVIPFTINEYPLFSFWLGDVHSHILGMVPQTALILFATLAIISWKNMRQSSRMLLIFLTGVGLGTGLAMNSWDIFLQVSLVLMTGIVILWQCTRNSKYSEIKSKIVMMLQEIQKPLEGSFFIRQFSCARGTLLWLILIPVIGILCYLPFYLMMNAQGVKGIGFVSTPSALTSFLLVNGWFFLILTFSLISRLRRSPWIILAAIPFLLLGYFAAALCAILLVAVAIRRDGTPDLFAFLGLLLLLFCEILYLQDPLGGNLFRQNTVFKLYYGAWLLLGLSCAVIIGRKISLYIPVSSLKDKIVNLTLLSALIALLLIPTGMGIYTSKSMPPTYFSFWYNGVKPDDRLTIISLTPTLDGLSWLQKIHPDDYHAINCLRNLSGNHIIVEADQVRGISYGARVSSFTGIPTILGDFRREERWRGDNPPGWKLTRSADIKSIYEDPTKTIPLMKKYEADILYVGPLENQQYHVQLPKSGLLPIITGKNVTVYQLV